MKIPLVPTIFVVAFTFYSAFSATPEEENAFVAAVRKAFATHDADALVALTCWDRVPAKQKQITAARYGELVKGAVDISLIDPDPHFSDRGWTEDGVTYHANLSVSKRLQMVSPTDTSFKIRLSVGEKDGKLFIVGQAPAK